MALSYIGPTIRSKTSDMLKRTKNLKTFKHSLKEHYLKELKNSNFRQLRQFAIFPTSIFYVVSNRYFSSFFERPQCKYKQFDVRIVLSCHQQESYLFVNIDEYNLFHMLLLLFTLLVFDLVFEPFLSNFSYFLWQRHTYTLTHLHTY